VAIAVERAAVAGRQPISRDREHTAGHEVEHHRARSGKVVEAAHAPARLDLAAQRAQVARQRVGDGLCAAARERPARAVAECREHEPERGRRRPVERQQRVPRAAGEERSAPLAEAACPHDRGRGAQRVGGEARDHCGVARQARRA
jgi:hypothetical protein